MKPSFLAKLVNGPFDDPGLYVRFLREGRSLMFDLGFTANLSPRDILKTSDIFVSHTHVDHFIGFDNILRVSLNKEQPLRLYGPEGFIGRIEGKLNGYTWNLINNYTLSIEATEIYDEAVKKAAFRAGNFFKYEDLGTESFKGILLKDSVFKISAAVFDHQVPCVAFSLEEDYHINIDKDKLNKLNLPVGPWLGDLKRAIRKNMPESVFTIKDKQYTFEQLKDIAHTTRGQKISYVVDIHGSGKNMKKAVDLVRGSDVLYIEAYFSDEDEGMAKQRYHLTAKQAGTIAREAGVGKLVVFHFSPRYINSPDRLVNEAEEEFQRR